jgi:hypothetical protein
MSGPNWFYWSKHNQVGPFSKKQLESLYLKGVVSGATLVSKDGTHWLPLEKTLRFRQVPRAPVLRESKTSGSHWYRHLGSTVCLILGAISFFAGLSPVPEVMAAEGAIVSGTFMILGAIAYRSAKKRRFQEVSSTVPRKFVEVALLLLICVLVLAQHNLHYQMTTHPVSNLIVPLWAIVAYSAVNLLDHTYFAQATRAAEEGISGFIEQWKKRYKAFLRSYNSRLP